MESKKRICEVFGRDIGGVIAAYSRSNFVANKFERKALFRLLTYDDWETKLFHAPVWFINELLYNTINAWVGDPKRPKWGAARYLMEVLVTSNFDNLCLLANVYSWKLTKLTTYIASMLRLPFDHRYIVAPNTKHYCYAKYHQPVGLLIFDYLLGNRQWVDIPGILPESPPRKTR
jgi:hypothetical protein